MKRGWRSANTPLISQHDRDLIRRLTFVLGFLFIFTASFAWLHRMFSKKFFDVTGRAEWIWSSDQISRMEPVVFFASRDFNLPANRNYTQIKILGDPEYALYFNGHEISGRRVGDDRHLDRYDVTTLARTGRNRIVVAVRSPLGVGGLIAAVDIGSEAENYVVTDGQWKIYRAWSPDLPLRDTRAAWTSPISLGEPPAGRWNFLSIREGVPERPVTKIFAPRSTVAFRGKVQGIRTLSGVAVAIAEPVRAVVYDFGPTSGRVRLSVVGQQVVPPAVRVRLTNTLEEAQRLEGQMRTFVFAEGEPNVTDPEVRNFRYVVVYGGRARAEVVK